MQTESKRLKGEDDIEQVTRVRTRMYCEACRDKLATHKQTFLLEGTRGNPSSAAYCKDDCSWCEDAAVFLCDTCTHRTPPGYVPCSRFDCCDKFAHMFLEWEEIESFSPPGGER